MTGEVRDGNRRSWHQRSKSSIGDLVGSATALEVEPRDALQTAPSSKERVAGWFKSRRAPHPEGGELGEEEKLEKMDGEEWLEKPVQRVVQGLYRDDDGGPSPKILVMSHSAARDAIREFSKDFLTQLKGNRCAAMKAQIRRQFGLDFEFPQTGFKFLVQAYIAYHFFTDFENASFGISNPGERPWEVQLHMRNCFEQFQRWRTKTQTVSKLLENKHNDTFLSRFCLKKYQSLISLDGGGCLFGGDSQLLEAHPDSPFYKSFLGAAVSVWLLQRLAFSFEQKFVTIYPAGGDVFQKRFMEPVVPGTGDAEDNDCDVDLEIVFTVFPGFRVSESIVGSSVYILEKPRAEDPASVGNNAAEVDRGVSTAMEDPAPSSPGTEVGQSAPKDHRFSKLYSLPATISAKLSESSPMKGFQKPSSGSSNKDGEHGNFFQKIIGKIARKKSLTKGKAGDESSTGGEPTAAALSLEELPLTPSERPSSMEPPSTTHPQQDNTPAVPGELSLPQPLKPDVAAPVPGTDNDQPLYIPRAQRAARLQSPLQSPLRSPRLSSVD